MIRKWTAGVLGALASAMLIPAGADACSIVWPRAQPITPVANALQAPTADAVPVQVRLGASTVEVAVARLKSLTLPPPRDRIMPAELGTVVETVTLTRDAAGLWNGALNANGWAQYPGEYVWRVLGTEYIAPPPPPLPGSPVSSCSDIHGTYTYDGSWVHRLTVLRAGKASIAAGRVRDGRVKVRGRVAKAFPGPVKLTVACRGERARTRYVTPLDGRWRLRMRAERGCRITAEATARPGWAGSEASVRLT